MPDRPSDLMKFTYTYFVILVFVMSERLKTINIYTKLKIKRCIITSAKYITLQDHKKKETFP